MKPFTFPRSMKGIVDVDATSSEDGERGIRLVKSEDPYDMEITTAMIIPKQPIRIVKFTMLTLGV
jgi:hypothetical protein